MTAEQLKYAIDMVRTFTNLIPDEKAREATEFGLDAIHTAATLAGSRNQTVEQFREGLAKELVANWQEMLDAKFDPGKDPGP